MTKPNRYLEHYGEVEAQHALSLTITQPIKHVLVVPAYKEDIQFLDNLYPLCCNHQALLIVVVNQPEGLSDCIENQALWKGIQRQSSVISAFENLSLLQLQDGLLLLVDKFQGINRIATKQGVGLARKVGCDIAASLITANKIGSAWIHTTDADTQLPNDYFLRPTEPAEYSAAIYPFQHVGEESDLTHATRLYEQSLHYYVEGLRWAGSPYAFHTIGSCLAINFLDYCKARGFPKRAGGEDFYLLNKLAKLNPVKQLQGEPIQIQSRQSNRAPFGTGPAVEKMLGLDSLNDFRTYDPRVFVELKSVLARLSSWRETGRNDSEVLNSLSAASRDNCKRIGIENLFEHLRKQTKDASSARHHINYWFDAFRTLKFIHMLQSYAYPAIPFQEALDTAKNLFTTEEKTP